MLKAGDRNPYLYRVISGTLNVVKRPKPAPGVVSDEEPKVVAQLKEKDLFGEISMLLRSQEV